MMPEFGFPAQPRMATMARSIADLRSRADDSRYAAVTGLHADLTAERGGRVSEIALIEKSISDLASYADAIALTEARAETMQQSLSTIGDLGQLLADTTVTLLTNATDQNLEIVSGQASSDLSAIVAALNVDFAGRTLFAGDDADGSALVDAGTIYADSVAILEATPGAAAAEAALTAAYETPGALFDTDFYRGGAGVAPRSEVAPGVEVDYAVRADEMPLRRVLMNTAMIAAAYDMSNGIADIDRRGLIERGAEGLRSAISEVVNVRGRLGTAEAQIANTKARNVAEDAALSLRLNDTAHADPYTEAVRLTEIERQLETAYATTARLASLSLANYL